MDADRILKPDLTVIGGGIAGTCAAVAAARLGLEVALVNDRPVLGGNSSSEVRVWVNGATGGRHTRYAREGGIMEEILLENRATNPDGNADLWDAVLQDLVAAEPNLSVYLNLLVDEMETDGRRVEWVGGTQNMSELTYRFESPLYVDATGDGMVAARTDAEWRQGREGTGEYGEIAAPETPDEKTLGSSIMFYCEEADEPVEYTPPAFAKDFTDDPPEVLARRVDPEDRRCMYWWIEYGGQAGVDSITDNEMIRDELRAIVYGVWDYVKNGDAFEEAEVGNLQLEWVGKIPGKRESRRFVGEYVLTETDLVEQRQFSDVVGHGGWSIDLHPPSGIYDDQGRGSEHWHPDGPYQIPYRILYPEGSENLWLAGRHVSASHVAFGSLRVQMTLATLGQAVGTAAAIARRHDVSPPEIADDHVTELQQTLLREDQWVMGVPDRDSENLAPEATITASHERELGLEASDRAVPLDREYGIHLATDEPVESVRLLVEASTDTELSVDVWSVELPENYVPHEHVDDARVPVPAGGSRWIDVPVDVDPGPGNGVFLVLEPNAELRLHARAEALTGVIAGERTETSSSGLVPDRLKRQIEYAPTDWTPCVDIDPRPDLYAAANVADGFARPYGLPHSWRSGPLALREDGDGGEIAADCWLELAWDEPRTVATVQLAFDTRLTPWYNALTPMEESAAPETVRDYRIESVSTDGRRTLATVEGNHRRFRRHVFDPVETDRIRIAIEATNGAPHAELFEVRAYGPDPSFPLTER